MLKEYPLLPLSEIVLPEGQIALRMFEPRLLSMVKKCLRNDEAFGVCFVSNRKEAELPACPHPIGTLVRIIDFHMDDSGLLTIVVTGIQGFRIKSVKETDGGVQVCAVELLPIDTVSLLPKKYNELSGLLRRVLEGTLSIHSHTEENLQDAVWVSNRLIELLPLATDSRHDLIDVSSPFKKLGELQRFVNDWCAD